MKTSTTNCDDQDDDRVPEGGDRKSKKRDVTAADVIAEASSGESANRDGGCPKRRKRPAESQAAAVTAAARGVAAKVARLGGKDASSSLAKVLRMQTLAYQRHVMDVVQSGDVSELKRFLEQKEGKLDVNFFDKDGQTALHHSCINGNFELVKVLVKFGADTTLANWDGWNPLHIATFGGHHDIVLYLIGGR